MVIFYHQPSCNRTTNLHVIDKYFRCSIFLRVFWINIRNWDHVWYKIFSRFWMFRVLSDIHLDLGSVRIISITRNTTKQDSFGIYVGFGSVRIHFYRIGFGSGFRVRFICPALIQTLCSCNWLDIKVNGPHTDRERKNVIKTQSVFRAMITTFSLLLRNIHFFIF